MPKQCPPNFFAYSIQAGDTFYSLAQRYNTTVSALVSANPGVNSNNLQVGQQICIPRKNIDPPCPAGARSYTVQAGDSFYTIAQNFSTTVDEIRQFNPGVNPDTLRVGQEICVPEVV